MSIGEDGDISGRYPLPRIGVPGGAAAEERELQEAALASLGRRSGRLPGLSCFEEMLRSPADALADGPVIGVFCNFFPEELIEAAGGVPVRLCTASVVAESVSEQVLPRDVCPIARASFGAVAGGLGIASKVQAVVVPTACDAKRRLGEMLLDYVPVVTLSIPPRKDHRSELSYWVPELERVARRLSRVTGTAVTRARLREAILHRRIMQDAFHDLENARRDYPHVLAGSDLALVVAASFAANWEAWGQATRRLAEQVRAAGPEHPQPDGFLSLVMTGAPILWPAWKLYHVIEDAGASVVTDTLCSVTQRLCDPVQVDDWSRSGMIRALALRYFSASLCPCFVETVDHTDRVLELVRGWGAHGVVAHVLRLCQLFQMQSVRLRHVLREEGVPFLAIDTELGTEDVEQIRVRVEAFLEMIVERRRT